MSANVGECYMKTRKCVKSVDLRGKRMSKENAEEDYNKTPISVLKYIGELEEELHLRREIERMSDKLRLVLSFCDKFYWLAENNSFKLDFHGPYTLQQCHDKLREISGEDT